MRLKPPRRRRRTPKGQPKPKPQPTGPQLYDLSADIGESNNIAPKHPDVVKRLTQLMRRFDDELKANMRPAGKA